MIALPRHARGLRVGLFGGSFDPPHAGHRHVSLVAMRRLRLDAIWWLVTPGNPLKAGRGPAPLADRIAAARRVAAHPRILVTGIEAALGATYTVDTLTALVRRAPATRFVWIMGADSLGSFHRWRGWRRIARMVPIAVVDRPGATFAATHAPAAMALARYRLDERTASGLPLRKPPAWIFLHAQRSTLSSTALRAARNPAPAETDVEKSAFHGHLNEAAGKGRSHERI